MLDAHQLNVFLIASETLNFTETGKRLHMTQPTVSQHIQALENHFDSKLFHRNGRHLELTDAGKILVPLARDLIKVSVHIDETMESLKGDIYGHLLVGCSTTPGKYVLPHLLARFHQIYPFVSVACQVSSQEQAIERLCNGEIHFALTSITHEHCKDAEFFFFLYDRIVLVAPKEHPWAENGEIDLQDLQSANFIMRENTSGTYIAAHEALTNAGLDVSELRTILTLGNSEAIALAVQEGLGVGFISKIVVDKICRDNIAIIEIKDLAIRREIFIGRQTRLPASAAQLAFWDFIKLADLYSANQEELQTSALA